jgi:hypothetical protein
VPSSTPFLARYGLEALATVRVEEDTGAVPRSETGSVASGCSGLSSSNGRLRSTARWHILPDFPDTRGVSRSSRTRGAGRGGRGSVLRATGSQGGFFESVNDHQHADERCCCGRQNRVVLTPRRQRQVCGWQVGLTGRGQASREGVSGVRAPSLRAERSDEAIHSRFLLGYGLLRRACHRARIRATRWLAMTRREAYDRPKSLPFIKDV